MIEFDKGQRMAMIQLSLMGTSVNLNLDMRNIKSEPLLKDSRLNELTMTNLKGLLEYVDHHFKVDPKSALPWKEQYCMALAKECEKLLKAIKTLSPQHFEELSALVDDKVLQVRSDLLKAAKVRPEMYAPAVSYQYHDGFNHMTRDDDFIAVRRGNKVIGIIALPGNDYNEVKKFLKAGGDKCLSAQNVEAFKQAVRKVKQSQAASMVRKLGPGKGIKMEFGKE